MNRISELKYIIADLLTADTELQNYAAKITPSRKMPGDYDREIMIFSQGSLPNVRKGLGHKSISQEYSYAIFWGIQFYKDGPSSLQAMDDLSDLFESAIYRILIEENWNNPEWSKITVPSPAARPPTPGGTQNLHYGRILVRIIG